MTQEKSPEKFKLERDTNSSFNAYKYFFNRFSDYRQNNDSNASVYIGSAENLLKEQINQLTKIITLLPSGEKKQTEKKLEEVSPDELEKIIYFTAHHLYCLALKSYFESDIESLKYNLKVGSLHFKAINEVKNADFLEQQLSDLESGKPFRIPILINDEYKISKIDHPEDNSHQINKNNQTKDPSIV